MRIDWLSLVTAFGITLLVISLALTLVAAMVIYPIFVLPCFATLVVSLITFCFYKALTNDG